MESRPKNTWSRVALLSLKKSLLTKNGKLASISQYFKFNMQCLRMHFIMSAERYEKWYWLVRQISNIYFLVLAQMVMEQYNCDHWHFTEVDQGQYLSFWMEWFITELMFTCTASTSSTLSIQFLYMASVAATVRSLSPLNIELPVLTLVCN